MDHPPERDDLNTHIEEMILMRRLTILSLSAMTLGSFSMLARAQDEAPRESPRRAAERGLFDRLDENKDGQITADEVSDERARYFERLLRAGDKNEDGKLSRDEFNAASRGGERGGQRGRDGDQPGRGAPLGPPNPANAPFFRAIDTDRDGKLSSDELAKASEALKTLDRNGDGFLTAEELMLPRPRFGGRTNEQAGGQAGLNAYLERIMQADADGDGKLSKEEAPERLKEGFGRLDANSDGFLDQAEIRRMFGRFQRGRGDEPGRRSGNRDGDRGSSNAEKDAPKDTKEESK